mmetsp:Transcript_14123/g.31532  ORF Transcript_14123/g.31532 Transcript_14123/m.31532 type:complete len:304 (-) Transcript_14123:200-1111(-)
MGRSSKKKAKGKGKSEGKKERCHGCSMYAKDTSQVCPSCQHTFCLKCVNDKRNGFHTCSMRGETCSTPAICFGCVRGETRRRLLDENDERERRGELAVPVPGICRGYSFCTNALDRKCAEGIVPRWYCLECSSMLVDETDVQSVLEFCAGCKRMLCFACRCANEMDEMRPCMGCRTFFCRGCNPVAACPSCKFGYCSKYCGSKVRDPCLACDKFICAYCDPKCSTEHDLCGSCYKPCTNPGCTKVTDTKRCGACRIARYCSKECQIAMWPEHKLECSRLRAEKDEKLSEAKVRRAAAKNELCI